MADSFKTQDTSRTDKRAADSMKDAANTAEKAARDGAQTIEDGVQSAADTGREGLNRMADETQRFASRGQEVTTRTMSAYAEAGKRASAALNEVNACATDLYGQTLADFDDLSRQAIGVKSISDALDLQNAMLSKFQNQMNAMTRIYSVYVSAVSQTMAPLVQQARQAPDQARNAA